MPHHSELTQPLQLIPLTLEDAKWFISKHHRHSKAPQGWKFGVGLRYQTQEPVRSEQILGVGCAGRPVARLNQDGFTMEITRVCTLGTPNANSMIYGALIRASKALGFTRVITYALTNESGSSLRAVGFEPHHNIAGRYWQGRHWLGRHWLGQHLKGTNTPTLDFDINTDRKICWELKL